jgi:hypothetical protein
VPHLTNLLLTIQLVICRLFVRLEVTTLIFKSQCSSMARLPYRPAAPRVAARVLRHETLSFGINRHRGMLDKEGETP